jgi:hypothetical protein
MEVRPMTNKHLKPATKRCDVGYGQPPTQFQFKKGQIGNPKGINKKASIAPDLRAILERALNKQLKLRNGERDQVMTKAAAGIDNLVNQFAKGDRYARRDLIVLAEKVGIDLTAGHGKNLEHAIAEAVSAEDEALLEEYVEYHTSERLGGGTNNVLPLSKSAYSNAPPFAPDDGEKSS